MIRKILLICSFSEEETLSPKASSRQFHSHLISHMLKLQRLEKAKEEEELSNIKDVVTTVIHQSVHHCSMGIIIITFASRVHQQLTLNVLFNYRKMIII